MQGDSWIRWVQNARRGSASTQVKKPREIAVKRSFGEPDFYKMCRSGTEVLQLCGKSLRELAKPSSYGEPEVIGAFLLQPHVARVIVGEFHNQHALVFR
jgi:hypothetical protein